jgi:hypothetical protein
LLGVFAEGLAALFAGECLWAKLLVGAGLDIEEGEGDEEEHHFC